MKILLLIVFILFFYIGILSEKLSKKVSPLSKKLRKQVLDLHNKYRMDVSNHKAKNFDNTLLIEPKKRLNNLKYSKKIEKLAMKFIATCPTDHDHATNHKLSLGENLYWSSESVISKESFIKNGINSWAEELSECGLNLTEITGDRVINKKCKGTRSALHYTQVIWENTKKVGCAIKKCPTNKKNPFPNYLVCKYSPPGNYNTKPYEINEQK